MAQGGTPGSGRIFGAFVMLVLGCGGAQSDPGADSTPVEVEGSWPGPHTVSMRPRTEGRLQTLVGLNEAPALAEIVTMDFKPTILLSMSIALAVGEGYPTTFTAILDSQQLGVCGSLAGPTALSQIEGGSAAVTATVANDARVELTVAGAGRSDFVARGTMTVTEQTPCVPLGETALELRLAVNAFQPSGVEFRVPGACTLASKKYIAPARRMSDVDRHVSSDFTPMFRVTPLDQDGRPTVAWNAEPSAQIDVRIDGPPAEKSAPAKTVSIEDLTFPHAAGPVTFTPTVGAPLSVEVVRPEQIDRIEVPFLFAGSAAGPLELADAARYGEGGYSRRLNRIAPMVTESFVGADRLCSAPAEAWFEWESSTPEVCATLPLELDYWGKYTFSGMSIGRAARLLADGVCTLTLRAPELLGGQGLDKRVSAEFFNVALLRDSF